jgi:hypothetical protein
MEGVGEEERSLRGRGQKRKGGEGRGREEGGERKREKREKGSSIRGKGERRDEWEQWGQILRPDKECGKEEMKSEGERYIGKEKTVGVYWKAACLSDDQQDPNNTLYNSLVR